MEIDINIVKELRKLTAVGVSECKNALVECAGDINKAIDYLREKGISKAYKKLDRETTEGIVAIFIDGKKGAILELNSETDFVARNEKFQELTSTLVYLANQHNITNREELLKLVDDNGISVDEKIKNSISVIGENINLKRVDTLLVNKGVIGGYVHNASIPGGAIGKSAALVALESEGDEERLKILANQIAMHVVATKPEALSIESLDQDLLQGERSIIEEEVSKSGKPESIAAKIIEGKLTKFYQDVVLLEQIFVVDSESKISDLIKSREKELKADIKLAGYRLFFVNK